MIIIIIILVVIYHGQTLSRTGTTQPTLDGVFMNLYCTHNNFCGFRG